MKYAICNSDVSQKGMLTFESVQINFKKFASRREKSSENRINTGIEKIEKIIKKLLTFILSYYIILLVSRRKRQIKQPSGCGSAWLERLVWDQEVAGSNPVTPTYAGVVQW